jgi:hypothetical protein
MASGGAIHSLYGDTSVQSSILLSVYSRGFPSVFAVKNSTLNIHAVFPDEVQVSQAYTKAWTVPRIGMDLILAREWVCHHGSLHLPTLATTSPIPHASLKM